MGCVERGVILGKIEQDDGKVDEGGAVRRIGAYGDAQEVCGGAQSTFRVQTDGKMQRGQWIIGRSAVGTGKKFDAVCNLTGANEGQPVQAQQDGRIR